MSMQTDIVSGFGFKIHGDIKKIADFVNHHAATIVKRNIPLELNLLEDCHYGNEDIIEVYSDISCDQTEHEGLYAIIANIMSEETGISFQYEMGDEDCESNKAILFQMLYPWQMNDTEKRLTEEELKKIIKNYVDELGIVTTIGYVDVEYLR